MKYFQDTVGIRNREIRPTGYITAKNKQKELLKKAKPIITELKESSGVEGIVLGGGLSRGFGDELSEVDLYVYLEKGFYSKWMQGQGPVPQGDSYWKDIHIDIKFLLLEDEKSSSWDLIRKWDASYSEILFDPTGEIEELYNIKDVFTAKEKHAFAFKNYLECVYKSDIVVRQWITREDYLSGMLSIINGISGLIYLLFLANDEYPPHFKWALNYSYSLEWKPANWKEKIEKIVTLNEITKDSLEKKRQLFKKLYQQIWSKIVGRKYKELGLIELEVLEVLEFIINNSPMRIKQFEHKYDLKYLSYEPIFQLTKYLVQDNIDLLIFDKIEFQRMKENNFQEFLEWNQKMLSKIKE